MELCKVIFKNEGFRLFCNKEKFDVEREEEAEQIVKAWQEKARETLQDAIQTGESITIETIWRPLGRQYGNCYYEGITFVKEEEKGDYWSAKGYRGSNTYRFWSDIGMTGESRDFKVYVDTNAVIRCVLSFIEDHECFDINTEEYFYDVISDSQHYIELDHHKFEDILDFIRETSKQEPNGIFETVDVFDGTEHHQYLVNINTVLNDEHRNYILDILECYISDSTKEAIKNAKTMKDFIIALEKEVDP